MSEPEIENKRWTAKRKTEPPRLSRRLQTLRWTDPGPVDTSELGSEHRRKCHEQPEI